MTSFDIIVSIASILAAGVTIAWMRQLAIHSGRDRPHDPERLRRFIANAPPRFHNNEVFAKATEVLGSENAVETWMNEPCIGLDSEKPVNLVTTPAGVARVKTYLDCIEHGAYA